MKEETGRVWYLDRRDFLKFAVGAGGGIAASPLPWWLTNDIALWTQNWSWRPSPQKGPVSFINSTCKLCPGACGIKVRLVGSLPVKIEGNPLHPVNQGGICPLGAAGLQFLYSPSRITTPLRRVGERGGGNWQEITWQEAVAELVDKLRDLRANGKPHTVACINGQRHGTMSGLLKRFLKAYGSPNYICMPSIEDTYHMTLVLMHGREQAIGFDLENARYILSFGCSLIEGWGAPTRMMLAHGVWRAQKFGKRPKILQVEARSSMTAGKSDEWIPAFPGTEGALALGIAYVIINEELYDRNFVENYTYGFDRFKNLVLKEYSPEVVSQITQVPRATIVRMAREFATTRPSIALWGRGKGSRPSGFYESMAIHSLNALVGNIDRPGGVLTQEDLPLTSWPDAEADDIGMRGYYMPRIDQAKHMRYPFVAHRLQNMGVNIQEETFYPINMLLVYEANPFFSIPDNLSFMEATKKVPYIVSFSSYMDETAMHSDLILPNHTYLERWDDAFTPVGLQYPVLGITRPVIKPILNTKHTGDVILDLAKELGGPMAPSLAWHDFKDVLKEASRGLFHYGRGIVPETEPKEPWKGLRKKSPSLPFASFDEMWNSVVKKGCWYDPAYSFGHWGRIFTTPTKKFEFSVTRLSTLLPKVKDETFLPHYEPITLKGERTEYPLVLMTYELITLANNGIGNPPFMTKILHDTLLKKEDLFVEINPKTAEEYGLGEGDYAEIQSIEGKVRVRVHLFEGAMPGVVNIPLGLGHTAYDEYLKGKGVNSNEIISVIKEPVSDLALAWGTRIKLMKV